MVHNQGMTTSIIPAGFRPRHFVVVAILAGATVTGLAAYSIAGHLDKAVTNGEEEVLVALAHCDFTGDQLSHQRDVHWENTHLALDRRQRHHVHVFGVNLRLRRDNFEFQCGHVAW